MDKHIKAVVFASVISFAMLQYVLAVGDWLGFFVMLAAYGICMLLI